MDRRYQVFVSSTYEDLVGERQQVVRAILSLEMLPAGMELFPAASDEAWTVIQRVIDESDYYIVIVAGRYGSTDSSGRSYTEREFEYALSRDKPILAFLHARPGELKSRLSEADPDNRQRLKAFRELLQASLTVKFWEGADNLETQVVTGLVHLRETKPGVGWIRGDQAASVEVLAHSAALEHEVLSLRAELDAARNDPPAGTAELAQGNDPVDLRYVFTYRDDTRVARRRRGTLTTSWDEILGVIGPLMMPDGSESRLETELSEHFVRVLDKEGHLPAGGFRRFAIEPTEIQTIKVQFLALGLIAQSQRKHAVGDKESYWTLTEYGRGQLLRVRARKRSPHAAGTDDPHPLTE